MDDETTEELTTSDSEYSDSFIATDDDLEEELTWDSEDSRPAGPSPHSNPWGGPGPEVRARPIRRTRIILLPDSLTENSPQVSVDASTSSPILRVRRQEDSSSEESDSDDTYISGQSRSSRVMASPSPNNHVYQQEGFLPRSPVHSRPPSPERSLPPSPVHSLPPSPAHSLPPSPIHSLPPSPVHSLPPSTDSSPSRSPIHHLRPRSPDYPPPVAVAGPHSPAAANPTEQIPAAAADSKVVVEEGQLDSSVVSEGEEATICTICMCPLTNSGTHRVVCLKCGHIFGQSCVERWMKVGCNTGVRRCPTCNKRACLKDIRILYLAKVVPLDTSERDRLLQEKEELAAQKKMLESDFTRTVLQHKLVVAKFEERIATLEQRLQGGHTNEGSTALLSKLAGLIVVSTATINNDGGCRVMAYNSLRQDLVVSQPSGNTVFAGFGVRVVNSIDWKPSRFVLLHSKAIRDLQFHAEDRDMLLSVSLDQNAKLFDLGANTTVHTFKGEGPLWSCCWDSSNPHLLLLGSQSGKVFQYDRRMTDHYVNTWETENNKTPVVALASAPSRASTPFPQGGFLSCRLNTVYSYSRQGEKYNSQELAIDGPFMSMRYDSFTQMMLTTSRPSSRSPHTRATLSQLDCDGSGQVCAPLIHSFNCGSSARVMSRSTMLQHVDSTMVVAHSESCRTLDMWSSKQGTHLLGFPIREPIIDLTPVPLCVNKVPLLAALSEKKLIVFKLNHY